MQPYAQPFRITEPVSNNIFSWERFQGRSVHVPACVDGSLADLAEGDETVFEDFDDSKKSLRSCKGLKNFVRTSWNGVPMAVVDNHNHALYFWYEARAKGLFSTPVALVHADEHSDKRVSHVPLPADATPDQAFRYANHDVNVGNFIQPLLDSGFFSSYRWVADEQGCERVLEEMGLEKSNCHPGESRDLPLVCLADGESHQEKMPRWSHALNGMASTRHDNFSQPFVLDFDADFFSPGLDYMDRALKVRAVRELARRASFITVATSPFFIEQDRAIKVIREIFT